MGFRAPDPRGTGASLPSALEEVGLEAFVLGLSQLQCMSDVVLGVPEGHLSQEIGGLPVVLIDVSKALDENQRTGVSDPSGVTGYMSGTLREESLERVENTISELEGLLDNI